MKLIVGIIIVLCILYLLMIKPRIGKRKGWNDFRTKLYAHRGLHDNHSDAPENSLKAFKKAVDAGFGIELDVQLTKDKIPVVHHDFKLQRSCGKEGLVSDYTYEELQQFPLFESGETIPKFQDVLDLIDGQVPLIVEIKSEDRDMTVCTLTDEILKKYQGVYCLESFNPLVLFWYRKNRKEVLRGQLSDGFITSGEYQKPLYLILEYMLLNFLTKPDFIAYNHKYEKIFSRRLCRNLYHNMSAAWTIKSEEELTEAKKHFDLYIFDSFVPKQN